MSNKKKFKISGESYLGIFIAVGFLVLFFTTNFGSAPGINMFLKDISYLLVASIGMYVVIMTGNIDISAGTIIGLSGYLAGYVSKLGAPFYVFIPIAILSGMFLASLTGILVTKFNVPSLVASLAMVNVHLGFFILLPQGGWVEGLEDNFTAMGGMGLFGWLPLVFILSIIIFVFMLWWMKNNTFAKKIYAVGGNEDASVLAGIAPKSVVMKVFLIEGAFMGMASMLFYTPKSIIQANATFGLEMLFISAVVIGGTRISGGKGKVSTVVLGATLIALINRAMIFAGLPDYYSYAVQGIIILVAVLVSGINVEKIKDMFNQNKVNDMEVK